MTWRPASDGVHDSRSGVESNTRAILYGPALNVVAERRRRGAALLSADHSSKE